MPLVIYLRGEISNLISCSDLVSPSSHRGRQQQTLLAGGGGLLLEGGTQLLGEGGGGAFSFVFLKT